MTGATISDYSTSEATGKLSMAHWLLLRSRDRHHRRRRRLRGPCAINEAEVWLIFHKLHTGVGSIAYLDALDEALCFGWVDSLVKRLDEFRYARKFTPRKADSRWSTINRKRYAALKAAGRLKPSGVNRAPTDRSYGPRPPRFQMPATVPRYIQAALRKQPAAWRYFERLAPSHRRRYIGWIESAKQEETKARRLQERFASLRQADGWDSSEQPPNNRLQPSAAGRDDEPPRLKRHVRRAKGE